MTSTDGGITDAMVEAAALAFPLWKNDTGFRNALRVGLGYTLAAQKGEAVEAYHVVDHGPGAVGIGTKADGLIANLCGNIETLHSTATFMVRALNSYVQKGGGVREGLAAMQPGERLTSLLVELVRMCKVDGVGIIDLTLNDVVIGGENTGNWKLDLISLRSYLASPSPASWNEAVREDAREGMATVFELATSASWNEAVAQAVVDVFERWIRLDGPTPPHGMLVEVLEAIRALTRPDPAPEETGK